jgi:hypothetical protein
MGGAQLSKHIKNSNFVFEDLLTCFGVFQAMLSRPQIFLEEERTHCLLNRSVASALAASASPYPLANLSEDG